MPTLVDIRDSEAGDWAALAELYPAAFPEEDLLPLLEDLLRGPDAVLSLVATVEGRPVAHVIFTPCQIEGSGKPATQPVSLLGPLAVVPERQRQGIGSALVQAGLSRLAGGDTSHVFVLGDPAYYNRLGFAPDTQVAPPYPLPKAWEPAWQSLRLTEAAGGVSGRLAVPMPWQEPAFWQE